MNPTERQLRPRAIRCTWAVLAVALLAGRAAAERLEVEVTGIDGELAANARRMLSIVEVVGDDAPSPSRLRRLLATGRREIATALEPYGHYRAEIEAGLERRDDGSWLARFEVDPGPPLRVTAADLRLTGAGAEDPEFARLIDEFPLAEGAVLDHRRWSRGKAELSEYAARHGYFDADFATAEIRIDLERYQSELVLEYASGRRYRFGEVVFRQDALDDDLLRSFVEFEAGEPYRMEPVLDLQDALGGTGYFASVEVQPEPERAHDGRVPIEVDLRLDERQRWEAGAGYGTDTGARGTLALELRRLNRDGHRARAEGRWSQIERSVTTRYEIPGDPAATTLWTISAGWADLSPDTSDSRSTRVAAHFNRALGSWRLSTGLGFERESFEIGPDRGTSELVIPEISWSRSRSDSVLYPLHGHRLEARLRAGVESAFSDNDFVQVRLLGRLVHALRAGRPRLLARLELGAIETDAFRALPPSLRFFAGGDRSVRGYAYEELTPRTADGLPIGGEVLATASGELDALLVQRWEQRFGAAVFYDLGNALTSFDRGELKHGAGVGLRWLSPVGLVRADVAFALDEPGQPARFHLTIGPDL